MVYPTYTPHLTRRHLLRATAALVAGLALPRASRADEPVPALPAEPGTRKKILILGDSMIAGGVGLFLENGLRKVHGHEVRRKGKSSTGLARPDFFSWPKEAAGGQVQ